MRRRARAVSELDAGKHLERLRELRALELLRDGVGRQMPKATKRQQEAVLRHQIDAVLGAVVAGPVDLEPKQVLIAACRRREDGLAVDHVAAGRAIAGEVVADGG